MRKILILASFLIVGAALWPIYVGMQVDAALQEPRTARLGDVRITHEVVEYQRGHYRAQAASVLQIQGDDLDVELRLEHSIHHRLLGATARSRLASEPIVGTVSALWGDALAQGRPRAESWLGLGGGVSSRWSTQPIRIAWPGVNPAPERTLALAAGQGGLAYSPERLVLSFDTPAATWTEGVARLHLEQLHQGLLIHPGPEGSYDRLPDYDISLGASTVRLERGDAQPVTADFLRASASQNSTARRLDSLLRLRMDAVRSGDAELGSLDLSLNALNWHRPSVLRVIEDLDDVRALALEPDARTGLVLGILFEAIENLIVHEPTVQATFRLDDAAGKRLWAHLDAGLQGDPEQWSRAPLENLTLDLDLELARDFIDPLSGVLQAQSRTDTDTAKILHRLLEDAAAQDWVLSEDDRFVSSLRMEAGRLYINEQDRTALLLALVFGVAGGMF